MTANSTVTFYHYDRDRACYVAFICPSAHVHAARGIVADADGTARDAFVTIRVPKAAKAYIVTNGVTNAVTNVTESVTNGVTNGVTNVTALNDLLAPGDYVLLGTAKSAVPEKTACAKIMRITENFSGANPHIKIEAK